MAESLAQKRSFVQSRLGPWADRVELVRSVGESLRWGYRSKTTLAAHFNGTRWNFGMWAHEALIPIPACPIHSPGANGILELIRRSIPPTPLFRLAFVVLSGAQVVLVVKCKDMPCTDWAAEDLWQSLGSLGVEGFWLHLNPSAGRRIFGKAGWHLLWGSPRSANHRGLLYGPAAFQQLIPALYDQSLAEAEMFLGINGGDAVVDLYCGTGSSMDCWIRAGAVTLGVEQSGDAVECARLNTSGVAGVLRGACRHRVPQLSRWVREQSEAGRRVLLYANPPRTGLEAEVLSWIAEEGRPFRMAYLSCSPGTLSKNLSVLGGSGYSVSRIIPFDFFPQTHHVECLALLERQF